MVGQKPVAKLALSAANLSVIKRAMAGVNTEGTSATSFRGAQYTSAGKTGTAQVIQIKQNEKYDAKKIDERHRDHALFVAFAPLDKPQVAVAMIVENAGFGAQSAAPMARRIFDYWLLGKYPSEIDIAAVSKGLATAPLGALREVVDVPLPPEVPGARSAAAAAITPGSLPTPGASEKMRRSSF
jgi:penicillin-binding protein 2